MRLRTQILFILSSVSLLAACSKGDSNSGQNQRPTTDSSLKNHCYQTGAPVGPDINDANTQSFEGFWTFDPSMAALAYDQSYQTMIYSISKKGDISIYADRMHDQQGPSSRCVMMVPAGSLETPQNNTSRIVPDERSAALARELGMSEDEIRKLDEKAWTTVELRSHDSLIMRSSGHNESTGIFKRISRAEAVRLINTAVKLTAKAENLGQAFLAKWSGKDLKLVKRTTTVLDESGKVVLTYIENDSNVKDTEKKVLSDGKEVAVQYPKRLRFLDIENVMVNGTMKFPHEFHMKGEKLEITIWQPGGEDSPHVTLIGTIEESTEGGGLIFTNSLIWRKPQDKVKSVITAVEFAP